MQSVSMPDGETDMADVQALLVSDYREDVPVMDGLPQELGIVDGCFWYIAIPLPGYRLLHIPDATHPLGMRR